MNFFTIFTAFVMGAVVNASPVSEGTETKAVLTKTSFATSIEAALGSAVVYQGTIHFNETSADSGVAQFHELSKRQTAPLMVFCSVFSCSGICGLYTLVGEPLETCFTVPAPVPFNSLFISNPSAVELLFQVGVSSPAGCASLLIIPETNECFNISPGGTSWALLNTGVTF